MTAFWPALLFVSLAVSDFCHVAYVLAEFSVTVQRVPARSRMVLRPGLVVWLD
jgi:hypothetical protein